MRVGIAGPVSPEAFCEYLPDAGPLPRGMGGTPVTDLVLGLLRAGLDVSVYTLDPNVESDRAYRGSSLTLYVGRYRRRARHRALDLFRSERQAIQRFVTADRPDVVHAHWTYEFALGALSARPDAVVTVHDWSPAILSMSRDAYRLIRLLMDRSCIARARTLTCVSPYIGKLLERAGHDATVVPNMVSTEAMGACPSRRRTAHRILAANAGWGHWKNVEALLHAFAQFRRTAADAELLLCGAGYGPCEGAEAWASNRDLCDGVRFLGGVEHSELLNLMREVDLFVHPSLEESFGLVLIEAMAQGTPVIGGSNSGAVPWVLGDAGLLVDVRDQSAIAEGIGRVLEDDDLWLHYSVSGRENVETRFSESAIVDGYLAVYRKVFGE